MEQLEKINKRLEIIGCFTYAIFGILCIVGMAINLWILNQLGILSAGFLTIVTIFIVFKFIEMGNTLKKAFKED